jgi:hypothetical protein
VGDYPQRVRILPQVLHPPALGITPSMWSCKSQRLEELTLPVLPFQEPSLHRRPFLSPVLPQTSRKGAGETAISDVGTAFVLANLGEGKASRGSPSPFADVAYPLPGIWRVSHHTYRIAYSTWCAAPSCQARPPPGHADPPQADKKHRVSYYFQCPVRLRRNG